MTTSPTNKMSQASTADVADVRKFTPPNKQARFGLTLLIVAFFLLHALLSGRSAALQDDRYGWRMFHNVGFYKVSYRWLNADGRSQRYIPPKKSIVGRGRSYILPSRQFRASWYSDGTIRTIIESYAKHMGETELPKNMSAFEATLKVRINDEEKITEYIYRYPETKR